MRRFVAHVIGWLIGVMFAVLAAEVWGAVWFDQTHDALIYRSRAPESQQTAPAAAPFRRIHPYLGFAASYTDETTAILQSPRGRFTKPRRRMTRTI
jgi:hypothetical protein